jgi:Kef-type K+ transport system membrane component KefB
MPSFSGLLIVTVVAFAAPFLLGLAPRVRLPSVVLEIVAGIAGGPSRSSSPARAGPARRCC